MKWGGAIWHLGTPGPDIYSVNYVLGSERHELYAWCPVGRKALIRSGCRGTMGPDVTVKQTSSSVIPCVLAE
jgi:hypothetical protein